MSSDGAYAAFLEKANEDPSSGRAQATSGGSGAKKLKTADKGAEVPAAIKKVTKDRFYVSDADEPFEAVALKWDEGGNGLPDEEEFAKLVEHWDPKNADVQIQDPSDWNRNGDYGDIVDAVTEAVKGADVRVYRVGKDATRVEYFVVGCEGQGKDARLVGVRALSVES